MTFKRIAIGTAAALILLATALFLAREVGSEKIRAASPDGRSIASVRSHLSMDPPNESLWLAGTDGRREKLAHWGEDTHWCSDAVWSEDTKRVAFLINEAEALIVDTAGPHQTESFQLVPADHRATSREVRDLRFSADGKELLYRECARRHGDCRERRLDLSAETPESSSS